MGAEFFGTGLHVPLFDDSGIFAELSAENATARRPRCPTALPCPCNSLAAVVAM
jgi:hypothetical protein